tara:strand:- start:176 stop:391 length:216 start_codon:yes stop_codon:yes gene_type:complete
MFAKNIRSKCLATFPSETPHISEAYNYNLKGKALIKTLSARVRTTGDPVKAVTIAAWGNGLVLKNIGKELT